MRAFETILMITLVITTLFIFIKPGKTLQVKCMAALCILIALLQIFIEGYRWQMVPGYILSAAIFLTPLILERIAGRKSQRIIWMVIVLAWLTGSLVLPIMLPVFTLPELTGPYDIGTRYLLFSDNSRTESFTPEINQIREIPVQVYYPANPKDSDQTESYWTDATEWSRVWMTAYGFGWLPFAWTHLKYVKTHAYAKAPLLIGEERYPVILFSHGYWHFSKFNTSLLEELASHGYVVISISHNYETPLSIYPDGNIQSFSRSNPEFAKRSADDQNLMLIGPIFKKISQTENLEELQKLYRQFYDLFPHWNESNAIWVKDTQFCIDQLERLNIELFQNRLDLQRMGVVGFSFGGDVAGLMALQDTRIKAGVNLDGWQHGHLIGKNLTCPFMFISSEGHGWHNDFFFERAEDTVYDIVIKGTRHANFNDMALALPVPGKLIGRLGKINSRYGNHLIKNCVSSFFNLHLKGKESVFLKDSLQTFPEVEMKMKTGE